MCGIAGVIDYAGKQNPGEIITAMVERLSHRGPDGSGIFSEDNVAVGHTRLSIIDLDGGRQPMATPDRGVHLTYNGEIYNYQDLQKQLEARGYRFRTSSDTEVVLYAYEAWGKRCVERLEGMFAFAIADFRKREVFLARDPFGIKPLLYRATNESLTFASEFQALQAAHDWTGEIDLSAIDQYLRFQYIPAPRTVFRKTLKLPAGHRMTVRMDEPYQKIERYWEPDFTKKRSLTGASLTEQLDDALRDSVRRHLVSDVPFGALLSGGIDSSLVVGYMSELLDQPVKTFSIGFEDESVNELQYARQVAEKYQTEHHEEIVRFDALEMLPEIVRHYGEPFGDQSAIPTWAVSKLARQRVPMVLSGDGGDEIFAGYSTYAAWKLATERHRTKSDHSWKRHFRPIAQRLGLRNYIRPVDPESTTEHWIPCVGRFTGNDREQLWQSEYRFLTDLPDTELELSFQRSHGCTGVNRVQYVDIETYLPENILAKVDIGTMRYGLEARPPMLDRRFFDLASSVPVDELFFDAYTGKRPLRELAAKKLGRDFAYRRKQGFELPLDSWLRRDLINAELVRDRLTSSSANIMHWFEPTFIDRTIRSGRAVNIWLLLVLEEWMDQQSPRIVNSDTLDQPAPESSS